jgi:four helix bundle protein
MSNLSAKTFDFGIRIIELANYLEDERKLFPLIGRLLECGTGIGVSLHIAEEYAGNRNESFVNAYRASLETEFLLELLVKTGFIYENQSVPLLKDCRFIKDEIRSLISQKTK